MLWDYTVQINVLTNTDDWFVCNINLAANITIIAWMLDKRQQKWWPGHVAKGCLMISLDNEMHMSIIDEIQIRK